MSNPFHFIASRIVPSRDACFDRGDLSDDLFLAEASRIPHDLPAGLHHAAELRAAGPAAKHAQGTSAAHGETRANRQVLEWIFRDLQLVVVQY